MEKPERIHNLNSRYNEISQKLSFELLKLAPDIIVITTCRKQLSQLDKDIRRIQLLKDWN